MFEQLISSLNTLTEVHVAISKRLTLGEALIDSLSPIMVLPGQRFGPMKLKAGLKITVGHQSIFCTFFTNDCPTLLCTSHEGQSLRTVNVQVSTHASCMSNHSLCSKIRLVLVAPT